MQKLMGLVRRCVDDYHMIEAGDRIAVGVSGGKDSLALLVLLAGLREYFNKPYELEAVSYTHLVCPCVPSLQENIRLHTFWFRLISNFSLVPANDV